eukprot:CFRG6616T1
MIWFGGNAGEAVQQVRKKCQLLLVYIAKREEDSSAWNNEAVRSALDKAENSVVCLRLLVGDEDCANFCSIYPVMKSPTTYFLSPSGQPYDVMISEHTVEALVNAIEGALLKHRSDSTAAVITAPTVTSATPPTDTVTPPTDTVTSTHTAQRKSTTTLTDQKVGETPRLNVKKDEQSQTLNSSPTTIPKNATISDKGKEKVMTPAEKAQDLKRKLEARREAAAKADLEREKEAEIKRRKDSREMFDAERKRKEMGMKQMQIDIKRQRQADVEARALIKQQIKEDRDEKLQREYERKTVNAARALVDTHETTPTGHASGILPTCPSQQKTYDVARIQFRFHDGSVHRHEFKNPLTQTLRDMCEYLVSNHCDLAGPHPKLLTNFPSRVYVDDDMDSSLQMLGLTPSAVVIVRKPRVARDVSASSNTRSLASANPLYAVYGMIMAWFAYMRQFIVFRQAPNQNKKNSEASPDDRSHPDHRVKKSRLLQGQRVPTRSQPQENDSGIRQQSTDKSRGGIYRFRNPDDAERDPSDRNEAYNGNSTAQE